MLSRYMVSSVRCSVYREFKVQMTFINRALAETIKLNRELVITLDPTSSSRISNLQIHPTVFGQTMVGNRLLFMGATRCCLHRRVLPKGLLCTEMLPNTMVGRTVTTSFTSHERVTIDGEARNVVARRAHTRSRHHQRQQSLPPPKQATAQSNPDPCSQPYCLCQPACHHHGNRRRW